MLPLDQAFTFRDQAVAWGIGSGMSAFGLITSALPPRADVAAVGRESP